eukprot:UN30325
MQEEHDLCDTYISCNEYKVCDIEPESFACEDKPHYFNGVGRKDPVDPHVFTPQISNQKSIVLNSLIIA